MARPKMEPLAYSPQQAGELLGITKQSVYKMMDNRELKHFRLLSRRYVTKEEIDRILSTAKLGRRNAD